MNDIMLDLETMGNGQNPALLSIAAVQFDLLTGETGAEFHIKIDLQSSIDAGLVVDASTVKWWMEQNDQARAQVMEGGTYLNSALCQFSTWVTSNFKDLDGLGVWGNSIRADNVWMQSAYKAARLPMPWAHWCDRDVRTIVDIGRRVAGVDYKKTMPFGGVQHDALDDCKHQIKYVCAIIRDIDNKTIAGSD